MCVVKCCGHSVNNVYRQGFIQGGGIPGKFPPPPPKASSPPPPPSKILASIFNVNNYLKTLFQYTFTSVKML